MILLGLFLWVLEPVGDGILGFLWAAIAIARWVLLIGGIGWIVYNIVVWRTAEFAVTNLRVLRYEGLFMQRRSSETLLISVSDVKLNVASRGQVTGLRRPADLHPVRRRRRRRLHLDRRAGRVPQRDDDRQAPGPGGEPARAGPCAGRCPPRRRRPHAPAAPAPAAASAEDQAASLVRLAELRDQGVISPEEFEAKKTEILARM